MAASAVLLTLLAVEGARAEGESPAAPGAQAPASAGSTAEATQKYERGITAYNAGEYEEALALFREALELTRKSKLHYNLALANQALRRHEDALKELQLFFTERGDGGNAVLRGHAETLLCGVLESLGRVARLKLLVTPQGAAVSVAGRVAGSSPVTDEICVEPGRYELKATLGGYQPGELEFTAVVGKGAAQELVLQLEMVEAPPARPSPVATKPAPMSPLQPAEPYPEPDAFRLPAWVGRWKPLGYVLAIGGGTLAVAGTVLALTARSAAEDAKSAAKRAETDPQWDRAKEDWDSAKLRNTLGWVAAGTGVTISGLGAAVMVLPKDPGLLNAETASPGEVAGSRLGIAVGGEW